MKHTKPWLLLFALGKHEAAQASRQLLVCNQNPLTVISQRDNFAAAADAYGLKTLGEQPIALVHNLRIFHAKLLLTVVQINHQLNIEKSTNAKLSLSG